MSNTGQPEREENYKVPGFFVCGTVHPERLN